MSVLYMLDIEVCKAKSSYGLPGTSMCGCAKKNIKPQHSIVGPIDVDCQWSTGKTV